MKPKWQFVAKIWVERGIWLISIGTIVTAILAINYFLTIYDPKKLAEFGDLGWQVFYEDFPYFWMLVWIIFALGGGTLLLHIGNNYRRSWQKNVLITIGVAVLIAMVMLIIKLLT